MSTTNSPAEPAPAGSAFDTLFPRSAPLTMSSREIAEFADKRHDNVIRDIEKMLQDVGEDVLRFEGVYAGGNGEDRRCYHLPKNLTLNLVAGYRADIRLKIIDRWMELEAPQRPVRAPNPAPRQQNTARAVSSTFRSYYGIAKLIGLDSNQCALGAARATRKSHGVDPLELIEVGAFVAPQQEHLLTPTDIGKRLGDKSARAVNQVLSRLGFQIEHRDKDDRLYWEPTAEGRPYATVLDVNKQNGDGTVRQIKWAASILPLLLRPEGSA